MTGPAKSTKGEDTKQRILDATVTTLRNRGIAGTSALTGTGFLKPSSQRLQSRLQ